MQHAAPRFAEKLRLCSGVSDLDDPDLISVQSGDADSNKISTKMKQMNEEVSRNGLSVQ